MAQAGNEFAAHIKHRWPLVVCFAVVLLISWGVFGRQSAPPPRQPVVAQAPAPAVSPRPAAASQPAAKPAPKPTPAASGVAEAAVDPDRYWRTAREEIDKSTEALSAHLRADQAKGVRFRTFSHGDASKHQIALTFDDGPHPDYTPELLQILKSHNVRATFFLVGEMAAKYPELVKAEAAAGHEIANHSYHHPNLAKLSNRDVATEMKACGQVIKDITGKAPDYFRPPGGHYNRRIAQVAESLDYITVMWSVNPSDFQMPKGETLKSRVLRGAGNGSIVLLHDGYDITLETLPKIITALAERKFEFVTVSQMNPDDYSLTTVVHKETPRRRVVAHNEDDDAT